MDFSSSPESKDNVLRLQQRVMDLEQTLEERKRELEVYHSVQHAIHRQHDLQVVLQIIADQARALTQCQAATVYLQEEDPESRQTYLRLAVISGELDSEIRPGYHLPLENSVAGLVLRERKPYCVQNARNDPRVFQDAIQRSNVKSFLIVPLISDDRVIGIISVSNKMQGNLTGEDERALTFLASSTVISIENARSFAQAKEIAVLNERNRLARELHDAVTQSLFSASLIGDVLPALWEENPDTGRQRLQELRGLTRSALAEMRILLLELRPSALESANLPELFRHLVNAFTGRTHIPVDLRMQADDRTVAGLPVTVKVAAYRIAQEALNNIDRHAEAVNVLMMVTVSNRALDLDIIDDGKGFDPAITRGGHFGLLNMRERASAVRAQLEIESHPDEGTQIHFRWKEMEASFNE